MDKSSAVQKAVQIIGSQNRLSIALGVHQQAVNLWCRRGIVPAKWVLAIETLTNGDVTRYELRPDIFGHL